MHHMSLRHGLSSFSASRRRTVSRDSSACSVSLTISSASNSRVQRARPSGWLLSRRSRHQQRLLLLPVSLRAAPGRGSSLGAASRLPSTKRRLVRYIVEPAMARLVAIASSLTCARIGCQRDLRPLQVARRVLATRSARCGQLLALALVQLHPVTYIHQCPPAGWGPTNGSATRSVAAPLRKLRLHIQAGPIPRFYLRPTQGARSPRPKPICSADSMSARLLSTR